MAAERRVLPVVLRNAALWAGGAALLVNLGVAALQSTPGYMDAAYYYSGGLRLAEGHGFSELILWNYLDDPAGLPHPSHAYWLPLPSLVVAASLKLFGFLPPYRAAQAGMVLLAVLAVLVVVALAARLTGQPTRARLAGLLAAFTGFYAPFLPATDSFGLLFLLGGLFFLALTHMAGRPGPGWALLGGLAGLLALTRADGLLWLGVAGLCALWLAAPARGRARLAAGAWVALGFALVAGPWLARNLAVFGTALSPGGGQALWLLDYNELFSYPASALTAERWLAAGPPVWLGNLWLGFSNNLQTALAVQGLVFLGPLALWAAWGARREQPAVRAGALAWGLTFLAMTFVFPLPGFRGGFFHSGAAFMPLVWVFAPAGLALAGQRFAAGRGLPLLGAERFFNALGLGLALLLTLAAVAGRVPDWDAPATRLASLETRLEIYAAGPDDIVMVGNPPLYFAINQRPAIVIPDGDEASLLAAARRYGAAWLLLSEHHPDELTALYAAPADRPGLRFLETWDGVHLFAVQP